MIIGVALNGHIGLSGRDATSHSNKRIFGERNSKKNTGQGRFANVFGLVVAITLTTETSIRLITFITCLYVIDSWTERKRERDHAFEYMRHI